MTRFVTFQCNASPTVGMGHLMRCRLLARCLRDAGYRCAIAGPSESLSTEQDLDLFEVWRNSEPFRGDHMALDFIDLCRSLGSDHAVLDDYRTSGRFQALVAEAGIRFCMQFDASNPQPMRADVVVNASPFERSGHYRQYLRNRSVRLLLGPRYAVLNPEFSAITPRPSGRPVRRILVSFGGGGDDRGAIAKVLQTLPNTLPAGVRLVVVSGEQNPGIEAMHRWRGLNSDAPVEFHIQPRDIVTLIAECDLAVIAGGTMTYEAARCGLPMILVSLAPNQERPCAGWAEVAGAHYLGSVEELRSSDVCQGVLSLIDGRSARRRMSTAGISLVDGYGGARILDALLEGVSN